MRRQLLAILILTAFSVPAGAVEEKAQTPMQGSSTDPRTRSCERISSLLRSNRWAKFVSSDGGAQPAGDSSGEMVSGRSPHCYFMESEDNEVNNLRIALVPFIPNRRTGPELLDLPPEFYTLEEHEGSFAELRLVNRYMGDDRVILKHLSTMAVGRVRDKWTVLDVATGSADIPVAIAGWARKRGVKVCITGVDANPQAIRIARKMTGEDPMINFAVADGLDLPFRERSFDFVLCSKTLHHFTAEEAARLIQGISRIARQGYIVMDLRRSWLAYILIFILTRLFSRNRITRFDGPLSVLRAYTPAELTSLASCAGASNFRISKEPLWRMVLCCMRQSFSGANPNNQAAT